MAKKKKEPKIEQVFEPDKEQKSSDQEKSTSNVDDFLGVQEDSGSHLSEKQKKKVEELDTVKSKISKILQATNIEIVDENFDDEYESSEGGKTGEQSQQDYDSLKAMFGGKDKSQKQEVTLTIDDFDYTYVGQYLEEYDLMHMKSIKHVRIQRKKNPKLKKILIIASLILIIGLGAFLGYFFTRETPVTLQAVTLNQTNRTYYVNDKMDYSGLYLIAKYSNGASVNIKLTSKYLDKLKTSGSYDTTSEQFNRTGETRLVYSYGGYDATYVVNVISKTRQGMAAFYSDSIFTLHAGSIIDNSILQLFVNYGDYGMEMVDFNSSELSGLTLSLKVGKEGVYTTYSFSNNKVTLTADIQPDDEIIIHCESQRGEETYTVKLLRGQNYNENSQE